MAVLVPGYELRNFESPAVTTGARLFAEGSLEGLDLKEFFLLLSSTGLAYRRCILVRLAGDQIGVQFLDKDTAKKKPKKRQPTVEIV